ncbi:hypothetical protein B0H13DRAFT_1893030 [Mycena leptocephala]|nr:hypothetical protein B0H13DRAFT_1893030 [Mycena leptocephala]
MVLGNPVTTSSDRKLKQAFAWRIFISLGPYDTPPPKTKKFIAHLPPGKGERCILKCIRRDSCHFATINVALLLQNSSVPPVSLRFCLKFSEVIGPETESVFLYVFHAKMGGGDMTTELRRGSKVQATVWCSFFLYNKRVKLLWVDKALNIFGAGLLESYIAHENRTLGLKPFGLKVDSPPRSERVNFGEIMPNYLGGLFLIESGVTSTSVQSRESTDLPELPPVNNEVDYGLLDADEGPVGASWTMVK